jgi:hypothetical protein
MRRSLARTAQPRGAARCSGTCPSGAGIQLARALYWNSGCRDLTVSWHLCQAIDWMQACGYPTPGLRSSCGMLCRWPM